MFDLLNYSVLLLYRPHNVVITIQMLVNKCCSWCRQNWVKRMRLEWSTKLEKLASWSAGFFVSFRAYNSNWKLLEVLWIYYYFAYFLATHFKYCRSFSDIVYQQHIIYSLPLYKNREGTFAFLIFKVYWQQDCKWSIHEQFFPGLPIASTLGSLDTKYRTQFRADLRKATETWYCVKSLQKY
jgi:hypothetical protein